MRLDNVEAAVTGQAPSAELAEAAGKLVEETVTPMVDFRAGVAYRAHIGSVLVKRALLEAFDQAARTTSGEGGEGA